MLFDAYPNEWFATQIVRIFIFIYSDIYSGITLIFSELIGLDLKAFLQDFSLLTLVIALCTSIAYVKAAW